MNKSILASERDFGPFLTTAQKSVNPIVEAGFKSALPLPAFGTPNRPLPACLSTKYSLNPRRYSPQVMAGGIIR
jgi:hypothetical protein